MRLLKLLPILACLLAASGPGPRPAGLTPNPTIATMLYHIQSETLYNQVANLSGERPVTVGGKAVTLATRSTTNAAAIEQATQYAYERFQGMGLAPSYHGWSYEGAARRNVTAEQAGADPNCLYLLVAHLDSESPTRRSLAPGADDNASGAAGVLAAAEMLHRYRFTCTLRYVLFTGEEQGLLGSAAYAKAAAQRGDPIRGVINLDMIGYNTPGSARTVEMDVRPGSAGAPDRALSEMLSAVIQAYQLDLQPTTYASSDDGSDHFSFWEQGFPAVLVIEDWNDHSPYYHETSDRVSSLDLDYFTEYVKAITASLAHLAGLIDPPVTPRAWRYLPVTPRR